MKKTTAKRMYVRLIRVGPFAGSWGVYLNPAVRGRNQRPVCITHTASKAVNYVYRKAAQREARRLTINERLQQKV